MFTPPFGLTSSYAQTILSSTLRDVFLDKTVNQFSENATEQLINTPEGITLSALVHRQDPEVDKPLVILIHGWLGGAPSTYIITVALRLFEQGFDVARLNLRDHGGSESLNEQMFHSARTAEVISACQQLASSRPVTSCGLLGFSLGGNFALRVSRATHMQCLAACPVISPKPTSHTIDANDIYRSYFVRKWRRALSAKAQAFPDKYDISRALTLTSVTALTDYFVKYHTEYDDSNDYFSAYSIAGDYLQGVKATIIATQDDPVIPIASFDGLPDDITLHRSRFGGHCGFLDSWRMDSWFDTYATDFFKNKLL